MMNPHGNKLTPMDLMITTPIAINNKTMDVIPCRGYGFDDQNSLSGPNCILSAATWNLKEALRFDSDKHHTKI